MAYFKFFIFLKLQYFK